MRKVLFLSMVFALLCIGLNSTLEASKAKKPKVYKGGQIVSLDAVIKGEKKLQLTKDNAKELVEAGSPLVFLYKNKIYFVLHEDGSFAFKKISNYAHLSKVAITGDMKRSKLGRIDYIIMQDIESFE